MADLEPIGAAAAVENDLAAHMSKALGSGLSDAPQVGDEVVEGGEREAELTSDELLEQLELFFSSPAFTGALQTFNRDNSAAYVSIGEGEEQPLSNYDLYQRYTKMVEQLLEEFLNKYNISQEDIVNLCMQERDTNQVNFALDYIIASTEYEAFIKVMEDLRAMEQFSLDDVNEAGLGAYSFLELDGCLEDEEDEEEGEDAKDEGAAS
mmetsp:Transcript_31810/g.75583  ORF Transcript_31810/g.75583 Transcript_31810/m.75583 type:complete len:208 (-) Transcript_31810:115-738(-)